MIANYVGILPMRPVITQPISLVIPNKWVTVSGTMFFSVTFFWVATTAQSPLFRATEVMFSCVIALNAYSGTNTHTNITHKLIIFYTFSASYLPTWYRRPSGEKMVMCLSKPAELPRDILQLVDSTVVKFGTFNHNTAINYCYFR